MEENSISSKRKKYLLVFVLISILLHLIILIFFLFGAFKKRNVFIIIPLQEKGLKTLSQKEKVAQKELPRKTDLPASLKPRKSAFGATAFFDDRPIFTPASAQLVGPKDQRGENKVQPHPQVQKNIQEKGIKEKNEVKEKFKPEIKKVAENKISEQKISEQKIKADLKTKFAEIKKGEELKEKTEQATQDITKRIKEIEAKQGMLAKAHSVPSTQLPRMQKLKTFGQGSEDKSPIVATKKSIIAMTKGYIENLKDKGNDWLKRKGDDSKRPSFEELKYISYEEKITWHLQSSWKQNFAWNPTIRVPEGKAIVDFSINSDGSVHDLTLLQSSGNTQLDQVILKSIEFASPLPPLPKHFEVQSYRTRRIIHVSHYI